MLIFILSLILITCPNCKFNITLKITKSLDNFLNFISNMWYTCCNFSNVSFAEFSCFENKRIDSKAKNITYIHLHILKIKCWFLRKPLKFGPFFVTFEFSYAIVIWYFRLNKRRTFIFWRVIKIWYVQLYPRQFFIVNFFFFGWWYFLVFRFIIIRKMS